MTIIAAVARHGKIVMGADRASSDSGYVGASLTPKIRKIDKYLIGYSSSRGVGQLLHFLTYPEPDTNNLERFMRLEFLRVVKTATDELCVDVSDSEKNASEFLVGVAGRLFEISTEDWSVTEWDQIATGSGYQYALGSLATTTTMTSQRKRIQLAIEAACEFSPSCMPPIDILSS